jgi:hypothetical protein
MDISVAAVDSPTSAPVTWEANRSAVSWAAVIAGAIATAATSSVLLALGAGLGLALMSPWPGAGVSVTTFTVTTAIALIVVQWLASALGGYLTGRLRSKWVNTHTHEVFFRDTAHGLLMWALATVIGAVLLGSVVTSSLDSGARAVGSAASGAASASSSVNAYDVDTLFRSSHPEASAAASDTTPTNTSSEATRILAHAVAANQMSAADRGYLAQLVATRTGLSQQQAEERVDSVMLQVRQSADEARKASASASIYLALSMLVGALIAGAAAAMGGQVRDAHP